MASNFNQLKSQPIVYEPLNRELIQFFTKRREYRNFMSKYRQDSGKHNEMTIDGKTINYALEFNTINNLFEINIINPITNETVFQKTFNSGIQKDIISELNAIKSEISNPEYYDVLNQLEELFDLLNKNKNSDDASLTENIRSNISKLYESHGKPYQKLLENIGFTLILLVYYIITNYQNLVQTLSIIMNSL